MGQQWFAWAFIKKFPQYFNRFNKKKYKYMTEIVNAFHENCADAIIEHRDGIEFPERIGHLYLQTRPRRGRRVDYAKSCELKTRVYCNSLKTNNRELFLCFNTRENKYNMTHKDLWTFHSCVGSNLKGRLLDVMLRGDGSKYIKKDKAGADAREKRCLGISYTKTKGIQFEEEFLKTYDEFKID